MDNTFFDINEILPKCWLQRIQKYWEKRIPTDIPKSSSTFSFIMTAEEKLAVQNMEDNLNTEDSIIKPEMIPDNEAINDYLGTYDVVGLAGVKTLLSPNKLSNIDTGVVVFHFNEENSDWEKVEDAEVIDGYVWGTLDSFSPVAVFTFRKDSYLDTSKSMFNADVYVCNGVKTKIYKDEEDKIIALSAYGKKTELTEETFVIGGTYDGSSVDKTDLYIENVSLGKIIGGSYFISNDNHKNHINEINLVVKNTTCKNAITGTGIWCCADQVNISVDGCTGVGIGVSESYYKSISSMPKLEDTTLKLAANQWIKKSVLNIKDSKFTVVYCAGNNGYNYVLDSTIIIDGGEYTYVSNGQSNGTVDNCHAKLSNCKIAYLSTNNRGHFGNADTIVKHCEVDQQTVFADPRESDPNMADVLGKVSLSIEDASVIKDFCVGAISNIEITTAEEAAKYITSIKVSRDSDIIYTHNADIILKDILVIK